MAEALRIAGVRPGDSVAIPEYICRDLLSSVHHVGAEIVFYPVSESLTPISFPSTPEVKAVIAVNYFGFAQKLDYFSDYCNINNAVLIEDNAHGFLSSDDTGAMLGTRTALAITSLRKTIRISDGATLSINDNQFVSEVIPQLPLSSRMSIRLLLTRVSAQTDRTFHLPIFLTLREILRLIRKIRTGHAFPRPRPESETEKLIIRSPTKSAIRILGRLNISGEQSRRRQLYQKVEEALADLPLRPVFPELGTGTVPYGYPFFSDFETAKDAGRIVRKLGVEVIKWPDLPTAVENNAPIFYRSIWLVNFL